MKWLTLLLIVACSPVVADDLQFRWEREGLRAGEKLHAALSKEIEEKEAMLRIIRRKGGRLERLNEKTLTDEVLRMKRQRYATSRWQQPMLEVLTMRVGDVGYFYELRGTEKEVHGFKVFQVVDGSSALIKRGDNLYMMKGIDTSNLADDFVLHPQSAFRVMPSTQYTTAIGGSKTVETIEALAQSEVQRLTAAIPDDVQFPRNFREWTDTTGKFKIEAHLLMLDDNNVILEKKDGKELSVPLVKLSRDDKAIVNTILGIVR